MSLLTPFHPLTTTTSPLLRLLSSDLSPTLTSPSGRRGFTPNFDIQETANSYILEGELPGLSNKDAVNIEYDDESSSLLVSGRIERNIQKTRDEKTGKIKTIEGEEAKKALTENGEGAKEGAKENKPKYWVSERSVGEFQRRFGFPGSVDPDGIKASLENGVLKVDVPKKEKRKEGRKITVQ